VSLRRARQLRRAALVAGAAAFAAAGLFFWRGAIPAPPPEIPFSTFLRHAEADAVAEVVVARDALDVTLRDGRRVTAVPPPGWPGTDTARLAAFAQNGVRIVVRPERGRDAAVWAPVLLGASFMVVVGVALYRATAGRIPSMEQKARAAGPETTTVRFADVAGIDEAKAEVAEIVEFLRDPQRYAALGGRLPKGVLLVGPPGTGKTLLARAIAGEAGVPFLFASGSDFVEMYAGVGAARVRRLFSEARRHRACIVFIDELDAVGRRRGGHSLSHEEREQTLNQLLVEMDGFDARQGIVVIAATNRQDILDPALLRPGRFDRQVVVGHPDLRGREEILRLHARRVPLAADVDLRAVARGTPGLSGADLANLVNEAALVAARAGRREVVAADLEEARDKLLMGVERRSLVLAEHERVACAYHEAGHAVVAAVVPEADPVHKITIIPRGRAMGVTMQLPETDRHTYTRDYLEAQIAILMGGRAAEEIFLRQTTSGAASDIERATAIAERMVCEFGMSALGPLRLPRPGEQDDRAPRASEATLRRVDEEIGRIVTAGYERARAILDRNREAVRALADELLAVESLDGDAIRAVLERAGLA
jgi:cell division protease FtsH